jgi:glutathionylspermidine synthase
VGDRCALASFPLALEMGAWKELTELVEGLARETEEAEQEIWRRPELLRQLGLPRPIFKNDGPLAASGPRIMRFDFHYTPEGWKISEVNSDVPGGLVEAEGFTKIVRAHFPGWTLAGAPATRLAAALAKGTPNSTGTIALIHATGYSDDTQVMTYLGRILANSGCTSALANPAQIRWEQGRALLASSGGPQPIRAIYRFFPGEWLPRLPRICSAMHYFFDATTPQSNPGWALASQSKRFGMVLPELNAPLALWRRLLPETLPPNRRLLRDPDWVTKPAFGRVGDSILMHATTSRIEAKTIQRNAFFFPKQWVVQKRFSTLPIDTPEGLRYCCFGVYAIDGAAAGIYGRCSPTPLIDQNSQDVAVLVNNETS